MAVVQNAPKESTRLESMPGQADNAQDQAVAKVDFKMVTFSLGGKDYGIDIMKVKEIAKFGNFTFVPNTPPFVAGVYNLRGDIISIIDLREMFNLPIPEKAKKDGYENGLILRLDQNLIGVIVDEIDRVVGIASDSIQPPHPIFGDVNIKYISGVVEHEERLYIVLDVERIFSREAEQSKEEEAPAPYRPAPSSPAPDSTTPDAAVPEQVAQPPAAPASTDLDFVIETLATFQSFHVSDINRDWVADRFKEWQSVRGPNVQLANADDAQGFLAPFYSLHTGEFWGSEYVKRISSALPEVPGNTVHVWNPGCGKGFETYSLAALLKARYGGKRIKIWASDKDLLNISTAPNLVFKKEDVPPELHSYVVEGSNGYSFSQEVKDAIVFEYHDVANTHSLPDMDLVLMRDLLSFLEPATQMKVLEDVSDVMKAHAVLVAGEHEDLTAFSWKRVTGSDLPVFAPED